MKLCIVEDNDETRFTERCGISVESFIEIRLFYLQGTLVSWNGQPFVQRSVICIGSRVAPILGGIFLTKLDRNLQHGMASVRIAKLF